MCQCSGMRFDVFQTSDKYKSFGGRPVHWPTTKNYLLRVSSLNTLKKTYTPKGVLFGSVEISTKLCPGVNV